MFEHKSSYKVLLRSSFPSPALWPKTQEGAESAIGYVVEAISYARKGTANSDKGE